MRSLSLPARFSAALAALPADLTSGPVGLAVSGGSDSAALMHLAARTGGARFIVLVVDHGLRPESAAEAAFVTEAAAALGLPCCPLRWTAPVPGQAAARAARHRLLAEALRAAGGRLLLTGHTANDQAETLLMRVRQGSGWYGLAGMRKLSLSPAGLAGEGSWIARPLLGETRDGLRQWLNTEGATWLEDPSNQNPAFERVRARQVLSAYPGLADRLAACQQHFARLRAIEDLALAAWLDDCTAVLADGGIAARFGGLPVGRAARALGLVIQAVTGRPAPPRSASLERLAARLTDEAAGFRGATLGGVLLRAQRGGAVTFSAEPGAGIGSRDASRMSVRLAVFRRLFLNSPQEIAAAPQKESFLQGLVPIFPEADVSSARDLT